MRERTERDHSITQRQHKIEKPCCRLVKVNDAGEDRMISNSRSMESNSRLSFAKERTGEEGGGNAPSIKRGRVS